MVKGAEPFGADIEYSMRNGDIEEEKALLRYEVGEVKNAIPGGGVAGQTAPEREEAVRMSF
jgi:hypothetical protein